jgi:alpha-glucosidase
VADESSIVHLYRRLLAARKASPALQTGDHVDLEAPAGVVAWRRAGPDGRGDRVVAVNMGSEPAALGVAGTIVVASDGTGEGAAFAGTLDADRAVLIDPAT